MSLGSAPLDAARGTPVVRANNETVEHSDTSQPPTVPAPPSLVGTSFDGYDLVAELGRGGMGVVYKANQKSLDRFVAIKMLLGDAAQDPVRLARFLTEARASASLNHANIVQIYHVGQWAAGPYFAMELLEGQTLEALVQKKPLSATSAATLLILISEAVHFAHTKNIVHRDLKPANIMIDVNRRPVVMDFGIAKVLGQSQGLTQQGVVMGTPAFMAPEQAGEQLDRVGPHSDVYSLCAILYNALTGRLPFDEGTALRTVLKVIGPDLPPSIRSIRPEIPEALEKICMKGLSKDPAHRYASAQALADQLRRFRTNHLANNDANQKPGDSSLIRRAPMTSKAALPSVVLTAVATGKQVRLFNARTVLGRAPECDIVLKSSDISKQHCVILLSADEILIQDLGSANGIQVNGETISCRALKNGDRVMVGRYEFEVRIPGAR